MAKLRETRESTSSPDNNMTNETPEAHPDCSSDTAPEDTSQSLDITEWPDRKAYGNAYWGTVHPVPEPGDPQRLNMFVKPQQMSSEEKQRIIANYRKALVYNGDEVVEEPSWTAPHLRPSLPRSERAENDLEILKEMGVTVGLKAKASVYEHHQENLGLTECMRQYYQGETHVDVKYVTELIRQIDQLKLEMATQLSCQEQSYDAVIKEKDSEIESLRESLAAAERTERDAGDDSPGDLPQNTGAVGIPANNFQSVPAQPEAEDLELTTARDDLEEVKFQLEQTGEELRQSKEDCKLLAGEIRTMNDQLDVIKANMVQRNEESKTIALAVEDMNRERAEGKRKLEGSLDVYKQRYGDYKRKFKTKTAELRGLRAELGDLQAERDQFQAEGNTLRLDLRVARGEARTQTEAKELAEYHLQQVLEMCNGPRERSRRS